MRTKWHWMLLLLVAGVLALAAGCGGDDEEEGTPSETTATETEGSGEASGGTLVFAGASDPVSLDPALVSDGESIRPITQIFETLVALEPGGTDLVAGLAKSWEVAEDAKAITLTLQDGVTFHDGTDFNAEAVCFNFDRWYNFTGAAQSASASYYWQATFGGYAKNSAENEGLGDSLYASCEATDATTAVINLTKPSASVLGALALQAFAIASPKALEEFKADEGTLDEETGFQPTGTFGTEQPIGTGPFKLESWQIGDRLTLVRNEDYWSEDGKAKLDKLIIRPISDNAARLQALQTGEIQGYDLVEPQDVPTIEGDSELQILERPAFNVAYVTINHKVKPFDQLEVRQAVAYGLDRQAVVDNFYGGRGEVAKEFMPPSLPGYADDVMEYPYDPAKAKQLLQKAGLTLPVEVEFWYPTDVSRPYMPDPKRNFEAFAASLNKSGFKVIPKSAPWRPDYLGRVDTGKAGALNLIGWTGDYADPDNFVGVFFQGQKPQWGFDNQELFDALDAAEVEPDTAKREELYQDVNRQIMEFLPGVPYAHSKPALAFAANVNGFEPSPTTNESFASVSIEE
ncbi:MAG: ABC transporter substrate-binding protein [Actinobacteria bacterium]|nr:ABC transporter substrate-binding protein [Actinomycetota bacterium]